MIELHPDAMAHGGEAIARVDGKAHFVAGAMPGETVRGRVAVDRGSWARVSLVDVVDPSPRRVDPPCPHFADCGGCQWQFADHAAQMEWKRSIVAGQLTHLGGIDDPPVAPTVAAGGPYHYRNRMDFRVSGGRPALLRSASREPVPLDVCLLLVPPLEEVFHRLGDLEGMTRITLRASVATGDVLAIIGGRPPAGTAEWRTTGVVHAGRRGRRVLSGRDHIVETVGGTGFRITANAFFQNNSTGAEELVRLATDAAGVGPDETLLDAYAGGGLFAVTVGSHAGRVIAVEDDPVSLSDLEHNLRHRAGAEWRVVPGRVEAALAGLGERWDVAVVDPPRTGLGEVGVEAITGGHPRAVVYVSCDPASLARDARLLDGRGYRLERATPVDMFPQTFHVETVARFGRDGGG
jgi:23S rRNA (uracil1939-C5)-methyltransferase